VFSRRSGPFNIPTLLLLFSLVSCSSDDPAAPAKTTPSGPQLITQWGSRGFGDGQFLSPETIALDGSNVYVADGRVQKFDANGAFISTFNVGRTGELKGIGVDGSGNVFVGIGPDINTPGAVRKFDVTGALVGEWTTHGVFIEDLDTPWGLAVDGNGNVYVAEQSTPPNPAQIHKFTGDGTWLSSFGSFGTADGQFREPAGIALDASGNFLYLADIGNFRIQKFDLTNLTFVMKFGSQGSGNGQFDWFRWGGIDVDASGNIYVTSGLRIQKFDSTGKFLEVWSLPAAAKTALPQGITVDSAGNIYIVDSGNDRVLKYK